MSVKKCFRPVTFLQKYTWRIARRKLLLLGLRAICPTQQYTGRIIHQKKKHELVFLDNASAQY